MNAIEEKFKEIEINLDSVNLKGNLRFLENSKGIIIFSHGSGSSRLSIRNNYVAGLLLDMGFSSLLFDLLTTSEDVVYENRFDIPLLSKRLLEVTKWVSNNKETKDLNIGFFGASTGAASALTAAAKLGKKVKAVVSRGGRPDLAMDVLNEIKSPTLLIVGGYDKAVIELNKKVQSLMPGICELKIVPGASHLFQEQGKLEAVAKLSGEWFAKYLN
ncbi:dienelactone hydrolase family protein [Lutibacter flavus]|uniref:Alpha/beta hydrolase family protein n=1 Tax=Lutibacter flavus TaxID=691689 RepID=A0A238VEY2_9FLAO|nr:alpha/beta hydrolase [Lutibacter flavus]SNR32714.1 Alpha/beta hydrolase family protein [Lutibacter flavus]